VEFKKPLPYMLLSNVEMTEQQQVAAKPPSDVVDPSRLPG